MTGDATVTAFADQLLRSSVAGALAEVALGPSDTEPGKVSEAHWKCAAEMGWTATMIDESRGGLGLGIAYAADICEEAGRSLFCGPLAETAVLLPAIARESDALSDLLPGIVSGEIRIAYTEAGLNGSSPVSATPVEHAAGATHIVSLSGRYDGLDVIVVDSRDAEFVTLQPMDLSASVARVVVADPSRCTRLALGTAAADRVLAMLHIATAADLLGVGEAALASTVKHVGERTQFGQPIGAFQAVKHRLADIHTAQGAARLSVAHAVREGSSLADARMARVLAADAALQSASAAIQLHGGSGFSWDLDLHLYLKRARRLGARNGGTQRLRIAAGDDFIEQTLAAAG